ncbi:hypothetical protein [Nocardioides bigeumensis]|uniref:Lipoprotein n=1 Tax=Nocardioides bigeumensis TaxID=433657 RepID=A0ABN2YZA8_9ACTN
MIGRGRTRLRATYAAVLASIVLVAGGCSDEGGADPRSEGAPSPSTSVRTLEPLRVTKPPATGDLFAEVKQSSRDAALGRIQVWVTNDREKPLLPTRVTYFDDRFLAPLPGDRLRVIPARSFRGYTLTLPKRPDCAARAESGSGTVLVEHDGKAERVPVGDEADVVQRFQDSTCFALTVAEVATLSWSDDVPVDKPGEGGIGTLILQAEPSGRGGSLTITQVSGTPLLSSYQTPVWTPDLEVSGDGDPVSVDLPVHPARCDEHVFMEAAGGTAFRVKMTVQPPSGQPVSGELILRMAPEGAAHAIQFARDSCGY